MEMSQRMAGAIHETGAMSPFAPPEISGLFEEWLRTVEDEILEILKEKGSAKPFEIAAKLKIFERSVNFFIDKMKKEGSLKTG
jgi:hypothetical protein